MAVYEAGGGGLGKGVDCLGLTVARTAGQSEGPVIEQWAPAASTASQADMPAPVPRISTLQLTLYRNPDHPSTPPHPPQPAHRDYAEAVAYAFGPEHMHRVPMPEVAEPEEEPAPLQVQVQPPPQQQGWPALASSSSRALGHMATALATAAGAGAPAAAHASARQVVGALEDVFCMPPPTPEMFSVALASGGVTRQGGGSGGGNSGGSPRPLPVSPHLDAPLPHSAAAAAAAPAPQRLSTASPHPRVQPTAQRVLASGDVTNSSSFTSFTSSSSSSPAFMDPLWPQRPQQQQQQQRVGAEAGARTAAEQGPSAEAAGGPGPQWLVGRVEEPADPGVMGRGAAAHELPPAPAVSTAEAAGTAAPEVRRGRGRPRKTVMLLGAGDAGPASAPASEEPGAAPRRGRGRPRKTTEPPTAAVPETAAGPGRVVACQAGASQVPQVSPAPAAAELSEQAVLLGRMRVAGVATRLAAEWVPCMSPGGLRQLVQVGVARGGAGGVAGTCWVGRSKGLAGGSTGWRHAGLVGLRNAPQQATSKSALPPPAHHINLPFIASTEQDAEAERLRLLARAAGGGGVGGPVHPARPASGCTSPHALANAAAAARRAACIGAHSAALLQQLYDRTGTASVSASSSSSSNSTSGSEVVSAELVQLRVEVLETLLEVLRNNLPATPPPAAPAPPAAVATALPLAAVSPQSPRGYSVTAAAMPDTSSSSVAAPTAASVRCAAQVEAAPRSRAARILERARCAAARSRSARVAVASPAEAGRAADAEGASAGEDVKAVEAVAPAATAVSAQQPGSGRPLRTSPAAAKASRARPAPLSAAAGAALPMPTSTTGSKPAALWGFAALTPRRRHPRS